MAQDYGDAGGISVQMEGPFSGGGTAGKAGTITIYANGWKGAVSPFSQQVSVGFATANSIVDLQPSAADLAKLFEDGIALVAENYGGTVTIHAFGGKPDWDLIIQASTREVVKV